MQFPPPTAEQIDRKFAALEKFAGDSWSNLAICDRVRKLRLEVREAMRAPAQGANRD